MHILYIQVQCISLHSTSVIASWFSILSSLGSGCPEAAIILYNSLLYSYSLQSTSGSSIKPFQKRQETQDNALSKKKKKCYVSLIAEPIKSSTFISMICIQAIPFLSLFGVYLIYNVVLISSVWQSDSIIYVYTYLVFPGGSDGEESFCSVWDPRLIPGLGRSPGKGNGNPLQYSCLENSMDVGAWHAIVHGTAMSQMQLSD